ncbi:hypothetical protein B0H14DRAFT_3713577 [Mycena olivaceomarginata]|nr:hypothetical protein B0H14DRAFT_3713577 [Mycena olivaceomarginata]
MARKIEWVAGVLQVLLALVYTLMHPRFGHRQSCACPPVPYGTRAALYLPPHDHASLHLQVRPPPRANPPRSSGITWPPRFGRLRHLCAKEERVRQVPPPPPVMSMLGFGLGGRTCSRLEMEDEGKARKGGEMEARHVARRTKYAMYAEAEHRLLPRSSMCSFSTPKIPRGALVPGDPEIHSSLLRVRSRGFTPRAPSALEAMGVWIDLDCGGNEEIVSWPLPRPRSSTASTHAPSSIVEARERAPRVPRVASPVCSVQGLHMLPPHRPICITGGVGCQRVRVPHYCLLKPLASSLCRRRAPAFREPPPPAVLSLPRFSSSKICIPVGAVDILLPPPRLPSRQGEDLGASAGGRTPPVRKLSAPMADRAECQELAPPRPSCNAPDLGCDTRRVRRVNTHTPRRCQWPGTPGYLQRVLEQHHGVEKAGGRGWGCY